MITGSYRVIVLYRALAFLTSLSLAASRRAKLLAYKNYGTMAMKAAATGS
jgi:hypothetical protein